MREWFMGCASGTKNFETSFLQPHITDVTKAMSMHSQLASQLWSKAPSTLTGTSCRLYAVSKVFDGAWSRKPKKQMEKLK